MAAFCLQFRVVQVHIDNEVQRTDFLLCHVVLRYDDVTTADFGSFEIGKAHIVLGGIGPGGDDLRCCVTGSCIF